jgi:hypothetical protein
VDQRWGWLAVLLVLLVARAASAQVPSKPQQDCLNALHKAGLKVATVAAAGVTICVRKASTGKLPAGQTADQCIAGDPDGKITRARAATVKVAAKKCTSLPDFGPTTSDAINDGFARVVDAPALFGADLDAALANAKTDKAGAKCQAAVVKGWTKTTLARLKEFVCCAQAGLKNGSIVAATGLESRFPAD